MPNIQYAIKKNDVYGRTYDALNFSHSWSHSPRVNGTLKLRANPWNLSKSELAYSVYRTDATIAMLGPYLPVYLSDSRIQRAQAIASAEVRASFLRAARNKDPKGGLGVSIATAGQSIAMLRSSSGTLANIFGAAALFYTTTTKGRRKAKRLRRLISKGAEPTAGLVLEGFFGWGSLLSDFQAAAAVLANPWPPGWVSVKKRWSVSGSWNSKLSPPVGDAIGSWSATGHVTYAAGIRIDNPNLWLANRLGLLNPFVVAWDLVPWSFLVNMVTNMGEVLGSLTDLAGITLTDGSMTTRTDLNQSGQQTLRSGGKFSVCSAKSKIYHRTRALAGLPTVTPYLRLPSWGVGTAAIAGSLLVQNTSRLTRAFN